MATNIALGVVHDRKATVYYNSGALAASYTTLIRSPLSQEQAMGASAYGKRIPKAYCKSASGSSASYAVKLQSAVPVPGVAEASWDWKDLVTFTAVTTDLGTYEEVELTSHPLSAIRAVMVKTAGTVTGLRVGYHYAQIGPRLNLGAFKGTVE